MAALALPSLVLAGLYFWLSRGGAVPGDGARVFYPGIMLYNYTAVPLSILVMLIAVALAVMWLPQAMRRLPRYRRNGLMAMLALAATALVCTASLPQMFVTYRHIDRAALGGRIFQLGARFGLDGDNVVVLCDCDRSGLMCRCQHLAGDAPRVLDDLPRLVVDPAGTALMVEIAGQTIYSLEQP
jgi:hypothetical protein